MKTKPMTMIVLFSLMLCCAGQSGCERHDKASAVPKAEARNLPPTATEAFHLQSECAEMGKKILENDPLYQKEKADMEQGKRPEYDVTQLAHYNAKDNHCYVEMTLNDRSGEALFLYDGQTGELLADFSNKLATGETGGTILNYGRVPASALPASIDLNNKPAREWSDNDLLRSTNNEALRSRTYIGYLMEEP
jgi:hypothetical protein